MDEMKIDITAEVVKKLKELGYNHKQILDIIHYPIVAWINVFKTDDGGACFYKSGIYRDEE